MKTALTQQSMVLPSSGFWLEYIIRFSNRITTQSHNTELQCFLPTKKSRQMRNARSHCSMEYKRWKNKANA